MEKQFPGCLGRMVNLFDLSGGVTGKKMLTDKPHHDGSLSRSRSDAGRVCNHSPTYVIENEMMVSNIRGTSPDKNSRCTPMKMLIAQEMLREGTKQSPPNVVAKLMGLDAVPQKEPTSIMRRNHSIIGSQNFVNHSGSPIQYWYPGHVLVDERMKSKAQEYKEYEDCKDIYEIRKQPQMSNSFRGKSQRAGHMENKTQKIMALVPQKFMEAKRLAAEGKLLQSKQSQDELEFLSSNKEFLLKVPQEPNPMFSKHSRDLQSIHSPPETKRITVLRPAKMFDNEKFPVLGRKNEYVMKRQAQMAQGTVQDKNMTSRSPTYCHVVDNVYQPTRIVLLKPNAGITHQTTPPSLQPGHCCEDIFEEAEDDDMNEPREIEMRIAQHMQEQFMGQRRDETPLSSVFSNGYSGDNSSFNKSEKEFMMENISDPEAMSPLSRHSWDFINRVNSPFSPSCLSRASYSPESSVCREAKKRLSERWATMMLTGNPQEGRHIKKCSSTLGEMLATNDAVTSSEIKGESKTSEEESRASYSHPRSDLIEEVALAGSPKNLPRSKSLPVSATAYGDGSHFKLSDFSACKGTVPNELTKGRSVTSSFKGKVSNFFFLRNRKSSKDKSTASQTTSESLSAADGTPESSLYGIGMVNDSVSRWVEENHVEELSPVHCAFPSQNAQKSTDKEKKHGHVAGEVALSLPKPLSNNCQNQDQPSPMSVLELSFEEDGSMTSGSSGKQPPLNSLANLIDKSPLIGSVARTLSWDDSCSETCPRHTLKSSSCYSGLEKEEQNLHSFMKKLLSAAGLEGQLMPGSYISRWHSPESPLDPSLRNKYAELDCGVLGPEASRRQRRSNRKLVFDYVNATLAEMMGYGSDWSLMNTPGNLAHRYIFSPPLCQIEEKLWAQMQPWFCGEISYPSAEDGESTSLVVERVTMTEVVGKGWAGDMSLEIDNFGKEIEEELLEELLTETVICLTVSL